MMRQAALLLLLAALAVTGCTSGGTDTVPLSVETGVDPAAWALVPAGEFLMGPHSIEVSVDHDYEIMVTDVTNSQYAAYLNEALAAGTISLVNNGIVGYYPGDEFHGHRHEEPIEAGDWLHVQLDSPDLRLEYDGAAFVAMPGYEDHPMVAVTWFGARAYCEFYGWRLPSEIEWEKAARGIDGRAYPWGDEIERPHANFYHSRDPFERPGEIGNTTPVGFYNGRIYGDYRTFNGASPYGLFDMAGNVWQWTANVYEGEHYRYMRGGSYANYAYNLRVWTRNSARPDYYSATLGFRCVRDVTE